MNKPLEWFLLIVLAAGGVFVWYKLALPRYQSINLSVTQSKAIGIARDFMKVKRGFEPGGYQTAVMFTADDAADRYLQRTLGASGAQKFVKRLHYDYFFWVVRFFKEKQKEEYKIAVSSATGEVIGFNHTIEDTAARPAVDQEKARQMAVDFLKADFGFSPAQYILHGENAKKYDNRTDYAFSWENKDVGIPWDKDKQKGMAKLLTSVTVSGNEILSFAKYQLDIPDGFNRYVDNLKQVGENLVLVFRIFYLALVTISIVVVVNRKHQVVTRSVKNFYIGVAAVMFVLLVLDVFNSYQDIVFAYPTTQSWGDYLISQFVENFIGPFFIVLGFVLPALAGESLRFEVAPDEKNRGFLSTLMSSFFSANISRQIFAGYLAAAIILGAQAVIFKFGFKYCGVWDELSWLTQATTTIVPAFSALVIGFQASFLEESMFRLFAINLFKKYGLPTALAVFASAVMWGFGHTGYEIYPMWFRGVEVTCIGLIMGAFYLRFGIMCVIAAHFLVDSFLTSMPDLLSPQLSFDFYTSLGVVCLPFLLALMALIFDRRALERPLSIRFNAQQEFNYRLLLQLYRLKPPDELPAFRKELERHGWDAAIIQRVFGQKEQ